MTLKFTAICSIFATALLVSTAQANQIGLSVQHQIANQSLSYLLDNTIQLEDIRNTTLLIDSPNHGYYWHEARGLSNPQNNEVMQPNTPFRIASITKTFTAARVLQLIEEGKLSLDTKIADVLADSDMPINRSTDSLSQINGISFGNSLTVKHLLNHTSGMRDYIFDGPNQADYRSLAYYMVLDVFGIENNGLSKTLWSPQKILSYYFDSGASANALNLPGQAHHYGDTNYLLLSMLIEKVTGTTLAENFRTHIYQPLNMGDTYLYWYEPDYRKPIAHHFWRLKLENLGIDSNLDIVEAGVNTSNDWGGGGIVSTATELNEYSKALFNGKLFQNEGTINKMLTNNVPTESSNERYGLGMSELTFNINGKPLKIYGHPGSWGTGMYYIPDTKTSIIFAVNQVTLAENPLESIIATLDSARFFDVVAKDDNFETNVNQSVEYNVLKNDSFTLSHDPSKLEIISSPRYGKATLDQETGKLSYQPNKNYVGEDKLTYQVCDTDSVLPACMQAKVFVKVKNKALSAKPVPSLSLYGMLLLSALLALSMCYLQKHTIKH